MRMAWVVLWSLLLIPAWAYHEGPGQDGMKLDEVDQILARATERAQEGEWALAAEAYEEALETLPTGYEGLEFEIRLGRDKAWIQSSKLPEAHGDLLSLVEDLQGAGRDTLLAEAREALANAQYYMAWLMRAEGRRREEWEPEVDAARQQYKLLAQEAQATGDGELLAESKENLEAAIKFLWMSDKELQGLPLPSQ